MRTNTPAAGEASLPSGLPRPGTRVDGTHGDGSEGDGWRDDPVLYQLDAERRRLRAVLDALPVGVTLTDDDGRIALTNEMSASSMRTKVTDAEGRSLADPAENAPAFGRAVPAHPRETAIAGHTDEAGRARWTQTERVAFAPPDGGPAQLLTVTADVTRFKIVEDELRDANESLDRFATLVSHDLLTPLSRVSSWMSVLKHAMADVASPDAHASLGEIDAGLVRMRGLVERLLEFSRDTRQALRLETVVLTDTLRLLRPWDAHDITLVDATSSIAVVGDTMLLSQLFENLIGNARKYAPGATVTVRARSDAGWCVVEVEDDGPGIAADESERIFSPFYRAGAAKADGHGMGLAFCRRIARAHGGDIHHDAGFERGARFVLRLRPA